MLNENTRRWARNKQRILAARKDGIGWRELAEAYGGNSGSIRRWFGREAKKEQSNANG